VFQFEGLLYIAMGLFFIQFDVDVSTGEGRGWN